MQSRPTTFRSTNSTTIYPPFHKKSSTINHNPSKSLPLHTHIYSDTHSRLPSTTSATHPIPFPTVPYAFLTLTSLKRSVCRQFLPV